MSVSINSKSSGAMTTLQRFRGVMAYQPVGRVPNWEAGAWLQTVQAWQAEFPDEAPTEHNWFNGEAARLPLDRRVFTPFHGGLNPPFEVKVLERDEETEVIQDGQGRVRRALREGAIGGGRVSMDTYLRFSVSNAEDWERIKARFDPRDPIRYPADWRSHLDAWRQRDCPLIFGPNTSTKGFYWLARELMGTEQLSYAWYDMPALMEEMMSYWADFLIEAMRPMLAEIEIDYLCFAEDLAMKTGPLLSPDCYRRFIYPNLKRVIDFAKGHGVHYVCVDTDGNPEPLIAMMLDAGVDSMWPLERAADQDPLRLRKTFGKSLRLWGGVDKRELVKGPDAIDAHLRSLQPLIEAGGFIPTVDHTVPPDVSWPNFCHYMSSKRKLLEGWL